MTSNPLISVSLVTFNHERFIAEAIDSVLRQTFGDWELIVVNDGSTDATRERVRASVFVAAQCMASSSAVIQAITASEKPLTLVQAP